MRETRTDLSYMKEDMKEIKDDPKTMNATQIAQGLALKDVELRVNDKIEKASRTSNTVITGASILAAAAGVAANYLR